MEAFGYAYTHPCEASTNSGQIVLLIRFSVIPSHFSTAVFSTCGVNFFYFAIATFATLPKQLVLVYVGVIFADTGKKDALVNDVILAITAVITILAGVYIYMKMRKVQKVLLEEQSQRREAWTESQSRKLLEDEAARRAVEQESIALERTPTDPRKATYRGDEFEYEGDASIYIPRGDRSFHYV